MLDPLSSHLASLDQTFNRYGEKGLKDKIDQTRFACSGSKGQI
jgi:hypothetical protein